MGGGALAVLFSSLALVAAFVRMWLQASSVGAWAVYTDTSKLFYEHDALLGWVPVERTWVWLGLDGFVILAGLWLSVLVLAWLATRWRRPGSAAGRGTWADLGALALGLGALIATAGVWSSGLPGEALSDRLEQAAFNAAEGTLESFSDGAPESWVSHGAHAQVVAQVTAGGETFDVSFGAPSGSVWFSPTELDREPPRGQFEIDVRSLDSGIPLRNKHAREYLAAEQFPSMVYELGALSAATLDAGGEALDFRMQGTLRFMGATLSVPVTGRLARLGATERDKLGLDVQRAYLLQSSLELVIADTPLTSHLGAFEAIRIPLSIRIVLIPHPPQAAKLLLGVARPPVRKT